PVPVQGSRRPALTACLVRGATAAGLGMGALTVLVMTVWISAPYPDDGPEGALHAAAALWLLSHGTGLVRADTLSGQPAPIGVVPLLLVALPLCLIHRAARDGLAPDTHGRRPRPSPLGAFCAVSLGYLLVAAVITVYAAGGSPAPDPLSTLAHLPLVTVAAAAAGVWTARGRPGGPLPRWLPEAVRVWLARTRVTVALRSAAAAVLVLVGGGALLVAAGLVGHADAAQDTFLHLSGGWSGRLAVLLLALALVPNAAVWGASYGLGPGFALGTEATATPLVVTGDPALPPFPLVAAVPSEGPGTPLNWAALAVPVLAALVVAAFTAARAAPRFQDRELAWSVWDTAAAALLAAVGCGVLTAVLSAAAGGPLGTERLAEFGPVWWLTGPAAFCWIAVVAVPLAVAVRIWRVLLARLTGAGMGMGFKGLRGSRARASAETPMSRASAETPMSRTPARTPMSRASAQSPGSGPPAETPVSRASAETPRSLRPPRPPSTPESLQPTDVSPEAPDTSEAPASPASPESSGTP
ncbi:cell division protein PerM, partial [Streptomyces clavuligerus]